MAATRRTGDPTPDPKRDPKGGYTLTPPERVSLNQLERPRPARLREEVRHYIDNVIDADVAVGQIRGGRLEAPVDDHRCADDVLARHQAPIAAVVGIVAIVAHGEHVPWRHHQLIVHHVLLHHLHGARTETLTMRA